MHDFARVKPVSVLFAGGNQPARRDLGISSVAVEDSFVPVRTVDLIKTPFCTVVELTRADTEPQSNVLLVAPLSGHFPVLLRDLIIGLLPSCRVYLTDWINIRHVPADHGSFGLDSEHFVSLGHDKCAAASVERDCTVPKRRASPCRHRASLRRRRSANASVPCPNRFSDRSSREPDGHSDTATLTSIVLVRTESDQTGPSRHMRALAGASIPLIST